MSKPMNEARSREQLLGWAKKYGCFQDLQKLFAFWDEQIKHAKSDEEREALKMLGIKALDDFFGGTGQFITKAKPKNPNGMKIRK